MLSERSSGSVGPAAIVAGPDPFVLGDAPFWPVDRLVEPDAWTGHIPFAFWLVTALRPRVLIELGTHSGNSYLAFCQAVRSLGIDTTCFAIDTWKGDPHAGFYSEDIYRDLVEYHDDRYGAFSRLVRSTFEEAAGFFADGSVDLLHIDGLHTYDAVRADLEMWRAKLSTRAVVLFHDTNVRELDFGVWRLWEELADRHPHFAFLHSHGLGVLGVGTDLPDEVVNLLETTRDASRARRIRDVFAGLGGSLKHRIRRQRLEAEITRLGEAIATRDHELAARDQALAGRDEELAARNQALTACNQALAARDHELAARDQALAARDEELASATRDLQTRTQEIAEHLDLIRRLQHETVRLGQLIEAATREGAGLRDRLEGEEVSRAEAERLRDELERARVRVTATENRLGLAQGRVTAMESSKFWKIRMLWFRVKRLVGGASLE